MSLLIRFIVNTAAIWLASKIVPGIFLEGWQALIFVAVIFGLVNALIRPVVSFITCLFQLLTLGLFTLVINALMLWLTSAIAEMLEIGFRVDGFVPAFLGAIIISIVSFILTRFVR